MLPDKVISSVNDGMGNVISVSNSLILVHRIICSHMDSYSSMK